MTIKDSISAGSFIKNNNVYDHYSYEFRVEISIVPK